MACVLVQAPRVGVNCAGVELWRGQALGIWAACQVLGDSYIIAHHCASSRWASWGGYHLCLLGREAEGGRLRAAAASEAAGGRWGSSVWTRVAWVASVV